MVGDESAGFFLIQVMIAHSEEWGYVLFVYGFFFSKAWSLSELNMYSFIVSFVIPVWLL